MKVVSSANSKKPNLSSYSEVDSVMIIKRHGYTFSIAKSYNKLLSCYMLSEYSTGKGLKAFGVPKMDMQPADIDRVIERSIEYLDNSDFEIIEEAFKPFPVVNDDDPEESSEPDYSDVKVKQRIKKEKEEQLKKKVEGSANDEKASKKKSKSKPKPKKKVSVQHNASGGKGKNRKNEDSNSNSGMNTLI